MYEKVFNRIFRRWRCDHDPVEYDHDVDYTTSSTIGYYFDYYYKYKHTTTFYKCSFCGHKSKETKTTSEKIDHSRSMWR